MIPHRIVAVGLFVSLTAVIFYYFLSPTASVPDPTNADTPSASLITQESDPLLLSEYWIKDFQLKQKDSGLESTITARLFVQRKRVTRFFIYQNMRELFLQDFVMHARHGKESRVPFLNPFYEIAAALTALESEKAPSSMLDSEHFGERQQSNSPTQASLYSPEEPSPDPVSNMLSRVVAVPANIRIEKGPCSLQLRAARFRAEFKNRYAALEGDVVVSLSSGERYKVPRLLLISPQNSLFFEEHTDMYRQYLFADGCVLKKTGQVVHMLATDALEEQEQIMIDRLGPKLPLHIRLFLGARSTQPEK